jgi:hypothetical protein
LAVSTTLQLKREPGSLGASMLLSLRHGTVVFILLAGVALPVAAQAEAAAAA